MRANRQSGSEGGAGYIPRSYPYQNLAEFSGPPLEHRCARLTNGSWVGNTFKNWT